jgi:hypothetical protein
MPVVEAVNLAELGDTIAAINFDSPFARKTFKNYALKSIHAVYRKLEEAIQCCVRWRRT